MFAPPNKKSKSCAKPRPFYAPQSRARGASDAFPDVAKKPKLVEFAAAEARALCGVSFLGPFRPLYFKACFSVEQRSARHTAPSQLVSPQLDTWSIPIRTEAEGQVRGTGVYTV